MDILSSNIFCRFSVNCCAFSISLFNHHAGIPTVGDLSSIYCRCRGIPSALPQLNFYLALSVFKMAGIAQVCTHLYIQSSTAILSLFAFLDILYMH